MWCRRRDGRYRKTIVGLIVAAAVAIVAPVGPAAAGNLFDFIFGGIRRAPSQVRLDTPDDAFRSMFEQDRRREDRHERESTRGAHTGFCVRLCDGRYFPVEGQRNASVAQQCNSFCPASETKIFSGSGIDHAVAADGQHYADLPNAFVYRKRIVSGCSCNERNTAGVARMTVADDPTLRPGDIVATNSGLTVYNGKDSRTGEFTPVASAKISKSLREQLADVKVTPRPPLLDSTAEANPQDHATNVADGPRRLSVR